MTRKRILNKSLCNVFLFHFKPWKQRHTHHHTKIYLISILFASLTLFQSSSIYKDNTQTQIYFIQHNTHLFDFLFPTLPFAHHYNTSL
ncbi:hypothetical protein RJT34_21772 [Clitoria ternatea]|uniref:Uncharacterized protein n=1 Tax=Clitoria ternatea TaxID=43366 RepID=A0AAN9IVD5_CLITE